MNASPTALTQERLTAGHPWPFVSILIPVFNEETFIGRALAAVFEQDYPADRREILVIDGRSTDRTRALVFALQAGHPELRLLDNPRRIVPAALNLGIRQARGDIIVRLDGHCEYPKDYVRRVVALRQEKGADNVGGVLVPCGETRVQRAIAAAYRSPGGFGGAALKSSATGALVRSVDAVHGGCWERKRLLEAGGFDEAMVRNQDDELSFRLRKQGGTILQAASIRVHYHVRDSYRKLFWQFAQYGFWKVAVIYRHPGQANLRHFVPAGLVAALFLLPLLGLFLPRAMQLALVFAGSYAAALMLCCLHQARSETGIPWWSIQWALTVMHVAYGLGFLAAIVCGHVGGTRGAGVFTRPTR